MKYVVRIELERKNKHASEDTRERFEQILMPEHCPETISELKKITGPLSVLSIQVHSEPTAKEEKP